VVRFTLPPLYPRGNDPLYPLVRRVGGPHTLDDVDRRKFLSLLGLELRSLGSPIRSQSLFRLRYPGSLPYSYRSANYFVRPINFGISYIQKNMD
jgi:hypothetical protein